MRKNSEGIAWHMAIEERDLLVHEFGLDDQGVARRAPPSTIPPTPQSPRSPIGGKLGEKLRGLKLATSPADLANPGGMCSSEPESQRGETSRLTWGKREPGVKARDITSTRSRRTRQTSQCPRARPWRPPRRRQQPENMGQARHR